MLKTSLFAAAVLMMATGGALASQDWRHPHHGRAHHHYQADNAFNQWQNSPQAYGGVNRFCGPGQIPESFPSGNGVRCAFPGGGYSYY